MQSQRGLLLAVLDEVNAAVQTARTGRLHNDTGIVFGFPPWACRWQVGGRKRGVAGQTSPPTTWGGINQKMLPYCESMEALYGEKRQVVYSGFCTNMILSKISPAETATRT